MGPDQGRGGVIKTATEAVTLVLATAGLVYIIGGLVLALRLWFADLPVQETVAQLPKELVVTVGLSEVIAPALIVGLVAVIALLVSPRPLRKNSLSFRDHSTRVWVVTGVATLVVLVPGTARALASYEPNVKWLSYLIAVVVAVVASVAVRMILNDVLSTTACETATAPELGKGYLTPIPLLKIGSTIAALAAVGSLIFVGGRELIPVVVCPQGDQAAITGHLIGQSNENAYVALGVDYKPTETSPTKSSPGTETTDEVVLSIGNARVNRVLYGRGAAGAKSGCQS